MGGILYVSTVGVIGNFCFLFLIRFFFLRKLKINKITILIIFLSVILSVLLTPWIPGYISYGYFIMITAIIIILISYPKRWRNLFYLIPSYIVYMIPSMILAFSDLLLNFRFFANYRNDITELTAKIISRYSQFGRNNLLQVSVYFLLLLYLNWRSKDAETDAHLSFGDLFIASVAGILGFILFSVFLTLPTLLKFDEVQTQVLYFCGGLSGLIFEGIVFLFLIRSRFSSYYNNLQKLKDSYWHLQVKHFEEYKMRQTELRKLRHDMKNHLSLLRELSYEKKYAELEEYLEQLTTTFENQKPEIQTGDSILDALLAEKLQLIKKQNIPAKIEGIFLKKLPLSPMDICTIFANALDNALEASEKTPQPFIDIEIKQANFYQTCTIKNRFIPKENKTKSLLTTKQNKQLHGFGLLNIKETMERNHGLMKTEISDDIFQLTLVFPYKNNE